MNEMEIKTLLVQYIIETKNSLIATEFKFNSNRRRADVIDLDGETLTTYEIKSHRDRIDRLKNQLLDYNHYFDKCIVVCEPENFHEVKKQTLHNTGILIATKNKIIEIKKAKPQKKLKKISLLSTLPSKKIQALTKCRSKHDGCVFLSKKITTQEAITLSRKDLSDKISWQNKILRQETSKKICEDDILHLSKSPPSELREP